MAGVDIEKVIADFNRSLGIPQRGYADGGQVGANFPVAGAGFPTAGANFPKAGVDQSTGKPWQPAGSNFPTAGADFPKAGMPQPVRGYATGGEVSKPLGIIPGPPSHEDNTLTPTATGEYIFPTKVVGLPADDIAAKINYAMSKNPNMTAKELFDEITFMTTGTPPNNMGGGAPGSPPPPGAQPQGFADGGEVQDPFAGKDTPPTPSVGLPQTTPSTPPVGMSPQKPSAPAPSSPPAASAIKPVGMASIGTAKDPLAKSFTGSGAVKGQPQNSLGIAGDLQAQREASGQQGQAAPNPQVWVGNPHGISSTMSEQDAFSKGLMRPEQRKDYQDRQVQQQELGIRAKALDNETALRQSEIESHRSQAKHWDAVTENLQNGGKVKPFSGGTTEDGKPLFYDGNGQLFTSGADGERAPYLGAVKKQGGMNGRGYQVLDKDTGQMTMASMEDIKTHPEKYGAGTSDPNVRAWSKNVDYHRANANFVNSIDAFGKQATDIMQQYGLNNNPKLANYTIQQLMEMKGMGSGEVAALNAVLTGLRGEMAKMAEGSLGVAGASVEAAKKYEQIINPSMPLKDLQTVMSWAGKEGQSRLSAIDKETNRLRKELGIKDQQQALGLLPQGPEQSTGRHAELVKKDLARGAKPAAVIGALLGQKLTEDETIAALRGAGMSDRDIAAAHDEYLHGRK